MTATYRPVAPERLTPREMQVLQAFANGVSRRGVAVALGITPLTLKGYLASIHQKFEVNNTVGAVMYAARAGLVELEVETPAPEEDDE